MCVCVYIYMYIHIRICRLGPFEAAFLPATASSSSVGMYMLLRRVRVVKTKTAHPPTALPSED